jgi:hypothetical protein
MTKIKISIIFVFAFILLYIDVNNVYTQTRTELKDMFHPDIKISKKAMPEVLAKNFLLDFAVPDAPAFNLLDTDPSSILRPTTLKELSTHLSDFIDSDNGISIPKTFAVEFSPGLLIGGHHLTLKKYQQKALWYRFRFAAATKQIEGIDWPSQMAFSARTSIIDESDLRMDKKLLAEITNISHKILQIITDSIDAPPMEEPDTVKVNAEVTLQHHEQVKVDSLNALLKKKIDQAKANQPWNKNALDVAAGLRLASEDSLGKNLRIVETAFWITYAHRIGTWGQWLLGMKAGALRDSLKGDLSFSASISSRLYAGINAYKMFIETQFKNYKDYERLLINGGGEARLKSGTWFNVSGGIEYDFKLKQWNMVSKFTIKIGLHLLKD